MFLFALVVFVVYSLQLNSEYVRTIDLRKECEGERDTHTASGTVHFCLHQCHGVRIEAKNLLKIAFYHWINFFVWFWFIYILVRAK